MIENPFRNALFPGLAMIGVAIVLLFINPLNQDNLPDRFVTPIIAFEFMQNTTDVMTFFDVEDVDEYKGRMLLGNQVDFLFMVVYSLFLMFLGFGFFKVGKLKFVLLVSIALPIIICLSDAMENINIGMIVNNFETHSIEQELKYLSLFTWIKWTGISSLLLIYSSQLIKRGGLSSVAGTLSIATFIACVIAFLFRGGLFLEVMATLVMISFLLYFIGAWRGFGYLKN